MLFEAYPKDCLIRPGFKVGRRFWNLIGPTVDDVATLVRVGGGWIAPVRFTSGECAFLRCYLGDGLISKTRVVEWKSGSHNVQALLRDSVRLPEVSGGPDPGVLYLRVADIECEDTADEIEVVYELHLHGILGHLGETSRDKVVAAHERWM